MPPWDNYCARCGVHLDRLTTPPVRDWMGNDDWCAVCWKPRKPLADEILTLVVELETENHRLSVENAALRLMYPPAVPGDARRTSIEDALSEEDLQILVMDNDPNFPCDAVIFHGPGHQSCTRCRVLGEHEVHEAVYNGQFAEWRGIEATTGFFDEPPQFDG